MDAEEGYEKLIKNIKNKMHNKEYASGDELKGEFYNISKELWKKVDDIKNSNLTKISLFHNFLIDQVCRIHSDEEDSLNESIFKNNLNFRRVKDFVADGKRANNIYTFVKLEYDYFFIGDIHSDTISLKRILEQCNFFEAMVNSEKNRLIFLGDYVDRGKAHLKTIELILLLKNIFPNNIYLLRGNHDGGNLIGKEVKLCVGKNSDTTDEDYFLLYTYNLTRINSTFKIDTVNSYIKFFNSLCNIAFISFDKLVILGVHGGIPRPILNSSSFYSYIKSIYDLTNENIIDFNNRNIRHNMLWSDPCDNIEKFTFEKARFKFLEEHFREFKNMIGIDILLRGHQAEEKGIKKFFNDQLYTIFSSGRIISNENNINTETFYGEIEPKIVRLTKKTGLEVIQI